MEIYKRTSQGRGEYEIAGTVDGYGVADLYDKELVFLAGDFGPIRTGIELRLQGGKPRLRRIDNAGIQVQRQVEAMLLLPKSIRDERQLTGGEPVILRNRYVLRSMEVKGLLIESNSAICELGSIDCVNDAFTETLDFGDRIRQLMALERQVNNLPPSISDSLGLLLTELRNGGPIGANAEEIAHVLSEEAERVASEYDQEIITGGDPLPLLLEIADVPQITQPPDLAQIDPQDIEIRRRAAARWRMYVDRGPSAAKFRKLVRNAYSSTCVICGVRWPASGELKIPGVDAAHILPWAAYDMDVVTNGMCLCKQHHWAFDHLLLGVVPDGAGYRIGITDLAQRVFEGNNGALELLRQFSGSVPEARLPLNKDEWPSPLFLSRFYEDVGVTVL